MTPLLVALSEPLGLLLGLAAVPLVLLFLLKRRRVDVPVSSTMLWERALKETVARSPFRRPSEWISLLLLLLTVAALTLAAAGLRLGRGGGAGRDLVIVIDTSAGMATATEDGTRFDEAKEGALALIRGLAPDDAVTAIAAGAGPRPLGRAEADRAALVRQIERLEVEPVEGDLATALELAAEEARRNAAARGPADVIVLSDFAAPPVALPAAEPAPRWHLVRCGSARENAGITHASVTSGLDGGRVLATVAAQGERPLTRTLSLERDGTVVDARELTVHPGRPVSLTFDVAAPEAGRPARCVLRLDPADLLPLDDLVHLGLAARPPARVLHVGAPDPFVDRLPEAFPGLALERALPEEAAAAVEDLRRPFDLVIATSPLPEGLTIPAAVELHLGVVPLAAGIAAAGDVLDPTLLAYETQHRWLRDVGLENLVVAEARRLELPPAARALVRTSAGAQLALLEEPGKVRLVWASPIGGSNLALLPAFPLLVRNLLGESLAGVEGRVAPATPPLRVKVTGAGSGGETVEAVLEAPDGTRKETAARSLDEILWTGPVGLGFYTLRLRAEGQPEQRSFTGTGVLSLAETASPPSDPTSLAEDLPVTVTTAASLAVERPVWGWLLALAALLLAVEAFVRR